MIHTVKNNASGSAEYGCQPGLQANPDYGRNAWRINLILQPSIEQSSKRQSSIHSLAAYRLHIDARRANVCDRAILEIGIF
jgi:hypothetical protein